MRNNLLIITDYSAPYGGNFIESIKVLHKKIVEQNNKIIYLFPERVKKLKWALDLQKINKFKIYFFKDDTFLNLKKNIHDIIKKEEIEILYTHFCRHKTQLAVKIVRILNPKIKLISHFHNHCKVNGNILKRNFMKFAYKLYEGDLNIGCSKSVCESMPYKSKKTTYVDNAIYFKRLDKYRDIKIKEFENKFVILMFGFDYYRKGVDIAIKAVKECNQKDIRLAILLATNKQKVEKLIINDFGEIPDFIKLLDPIDDIATYYRKADIFLTSSREEGLCYSVIEAAYCKTTIVNSDIPGIIKGVPGEHIFKSENYIELKDEIMKIYSGNIVNTKEEAYKYVKNKYDINKWADNIIQKIYQ